MLMKIRDSILWGFRHRTILCMAIKNSSGQIIGVIQLINKFDDLPFTKNDENFVEAFAIFCGMGIHNTHMWVYLCILDLSRTFDLIYRIFRYEKAVIAMAKQSVTLEVLSYHASASLEDAQRLRVGVLQLHNISTKFLTFIMYFLSWQNLRVPSSAHFQLHDFKFDDIHMEDDETLTACLRMFLDLDFVERFHIDYDVLCRWLLSVKKNYRNVTYHNWRHAFNVAQMMFAILTVSFFLSVAISIIICDTGIVITASFLGYAMVENLWWNRMSRAHHCLLVSRSRSSWNKQFFSN